MALGENRLGAFLKDRRAKVDPAALGIRVARRRTPGLRREEVAQRAEISATWYTWLEQGRGGSPSTEVLERIAAALLLTPAEREHLFLLAQHRPPAVRYEPPVVPSRLQKVIEALEFCPALVKTSMWDIVAWNRAAAAVLTDYATLPPGKRNLLRLLFSEERLRRKMPHWETHARLTVATFRHATARVGANERAAALVDELSRSSPEFRAMWQENEVSSHGEGTKLIEHPTAGRIALEYSAFGVDEQPDLGVVIYTPATAVDLERVRGLVIARESIASMAAVDAAARVVAAIPV